MAEDATSTDNSPLDDPEDRASVKSINSIKSTSGKVDIQKLKNRLAIYARTCNTCSAFLNYTRTHSEEEVQRNHHDHVEHYSKVHKLPIKPAKRPLSGDGNQKPPKREPPKQPAMQLPPPRPKTPTQDYEMGSNASTTSSHDFEFKVTKNTSFKKLFVPFSVTTKTSNKFAPLATNVEPEQDPQDPLEPNPSHRQIADKVQATSPRPVVTKKSPPPIVLQGRLQDQKTFLEQANKITANPIELRYARKSVIVYPKTMADHDSLSRHFAQEEVQYHTYQVPEAKTHAFVMRNMRGNYSREELKDHLNDRYSLGCQQLFLMRNTGEDNPLYLVITTADWTLSKLQAQVKTVFASRVHWEHRRNRKIVSQCIRCQAWGHTMAGCHRMPRCSKCAGDHMTAGCPNREAASKCANCGGPHRAMSTNCPVYKYKLQTVQQAQQPPQRFVPAPPPTNPAWRKGGPAMRSQNTQQQLQQTRQAEARHPNFGANYNQHFPARPQRGERTRDHPQAAQPAVANNVQDRFAALRDKFATLESVLNLDQMIKAIDHLLGLLQGCEDRVAKFVASQKFFTQDIHQFDI